ncbi:MAG: hypothetical protein ACKO92_07850, partial [Actinomycetota bacterium]
MNNEKKQLRILAPESFRRNLSRRAFIQGGTAAAGFAVLLGACGGSDDAATDGGDSGGEATGDYSRVINKSSGSLAMYTWGDYNDPDIVGALAESELGVTMKVDYYPSNEDLIT